ncbi:MAG: Type phosphodiesterase, partial [Verrucomicrobiales bacterium]|nr:Type phosphodiesterase [Verrucomicrobiales bacterium]
RLLQKKLGFRMLMDLIPLDANLVKGSHGVRPRSEKDFPLLIADRADVLTLDRVEPTDVYQVIKQLVLG